MQVVTPDVQYHLVDTYVKATCCVGGCAIVQSKDKFWPEPGCKFQIITKPLGQMSNVHQEPFILIHSLALFRTHFIFFHQSFSIFA